MAERLYQLQFGENFKPAIAQDVTPEGFKGLHFVGRRREYEPYSGAPGRFVREVRERVQVTMPAAAAQYLMENIYTPFEAFDQEELWVLLLNTKNWLTHEAMVYRGTINTVQVREAELLKAAVRVNAPVFILSHNHPSGDPNPSPEDVQVTARANQAAGLLGLELLDHIIVGKDRWVSLKERGLGFEK